MRNLSDEALKELASLWTHNGNRWLGKSRYLGGLHKELFQRGLIRVERATKLKEWRDSDWHLTPHRVWVNDEGMKVLRKNTTIAVVGCGSAGGSYLKIRELLPSELEELPEYLTHSDATIRKAARSRYRQLGGKLPRQSRKTKEVKTNV